jgi:hypothetical protein
MTLEEIQREIVRLPPEDLTKLRVWMAQLVETTPTLPQPSSPPQAESRSQEADEKGQTESTAEKLGRFAGRAFADLRRRVREK